MNLKKIIREEMDDEWAWAKETYFSLPETKKDLQNFVGWSFIWDEKYPTGKWGYNGRQWKIIKIEKDEIIYLDKDTKIKHDTTMDDFLDHIKSGVWALIDPNGYIMDPIYSRSYNKRMNESTGFEWMDDIVPENMDNYFKKGDIIKIHNMGNKDSFLKWLGDYSEPYEEGAYGDFIKGEIVMVGETDFLLEEENTKDEIYFPKKDRMEKLRKGLDDNTSFGECIGLNMFYELLNTEY